MKKKSTLTHSRYKECVVKERSSFVSFLNDEIEKITPLTLNSTDCFPLVRKLNATLLLQ